MDTLKKIIKYTLIVLITAWIVMLAVFPAPVEALANDTASTNSGKSLYDALRAIYGETSGSTSSTSSSSSSTVTTEQLMKRMETEPIGPKVEDTSLSESYRDDYKIYEEALGGVYTIYANITNGGVTNRPVVIDVPRGVGTSMKKDGVAIPFVTKQKITEEGAYVLEFFVGSDEDSMASFSEQTYLRAKFRFRIQNSSGVDGVVGEGDFEEGPDELTDKLLRGELPEDMMNEEPEEVSGNEAVNAELPTEAPPDAELVSVWDEATGYYLNTLKTGETFYTSLPNGSLSNEPVTIQDSQELEFTAYKDGKEFEDFKPGEALNVAGSYAIYVSKSEDAGFLQSYPFGKPAFRVRIISGVVPDIGMITAPYGVSVRNVRFNGLDSNEDMFVNSNTVHIDRNGDYEITFDDAAGSREVSFTLDNEQPVFSVDVKPNEAKITYYSNDVSRCVLYRGGKVESEALMLDRVTKAGKYNLVVYDKAGNSSSSEFTVRYRINAAAVIAIVAVAGLIAGVIIYVVRMKKNVKVV